jgi:hypothetical protein
MVSVKLIEFSLNTESALFLDRTQQHYKSIPPLKGVRGMSRFMITLSSDSQSKCSELSAAEQDRALKYLRER